MGTQTKHPYTCVRSTENLQRIFNNCRNGLEHRKKLPWNCGSVFEVSYNVGSHSGSDFVHVLLERVHLHMLAHVCEGQRSTSNIIPWVLSCPPRDLFLICNYCTYVYPRPQCTWEVWGSSLLPPLQCFQGSNAGHQT